MRLNEVRKIIEENIGLLNFSSDSYGADGTRRVVKNIPPVLTGIDNLKLIPSLVNAIKDLENISTIPSIRTTDTIIVTTTETQQFESALSSLKLQCTAILNLANSILPPMDENTMCIKLPKDADLQTVGTIANDFSSFFSIILATKNPKTEGSVKFIGVEAGSAWLYVKITGVVVSLIKIFTDVTYNIFDKYITAKKNMLELEQLGIKTDALADVEKVLHAFCEREVKRINDEESLNLDGEAFGKHVREIEKLVKILEMGTQIHPALTAPAKQQEDVIKRIERLEYQLKDTQLLQSPPEKTLSESNSEISSDDATEVPTNGNEPADE